MTQLQVSTSEPSDRLAAIARGEKVVTETHDAVAKETPVLETDEFKKKLLKEFDVKRVVYGHIPIDYLKGKRMAGNDGVAINVDGGFAAAYYNRGHSLVQTPHQLYGIILPTPDEIKEAERRFDSAPLDIELIDEFLHPKKVKDSQEGEKLKLERDRLMGQITKLESEIY